MGLKQGAIRFEQKFMAGLELYVNSAAIELETAMKEKRYAQKPWVNRTNAAVNSLTARASPTLTGFLITLSQGVEYGVYLELAHEKKYAVIQPTIRVMSPKIMETFQGMVDKLEVYQEPEAPPQGGG